MDLKVRITMTDEVGDETVTSTGLLDLASGEISRVEYQGDDAQAGGEPWADEDYDFTSGTLTHGGKDVEFSVQVNSVTGQRSVTANELLEIKVRAAALFAGMSGKDLAGKASGGGSGALH